ncbi:MAG: hypothetical protein WB714_09950 [Candidatus Sulfotelmatobacter sp.]
MPSADEIVTGNAAATAKHILASERLFRVGIVSELILAANLSSCSGFFTDYSAQ